MSGAPRALVNPLIKSLSYPMLSRPDHRLDEALGLKPYPIEDKLAEIAAASPARPVTFDRKRDFHRAPTVRSIQRFRGFPADVITAIGSLAEAYFRFLPHFLAGVVQIRKSREGSNAKVRFTLRGTRWDLLILTSSGEAQPGLERYRISGGWLQRDHSGGYLELRHIPSEDCILAVVQDYEPRLPWALYQRTQAPLHRFVMQRFGHWLKRLPRV